MNEARRGYLICGEPRSGTTFLCDLLLSTGRLGNPKEHLRYLGVARDIERDAGIDAMLARASTPNGIYGIKLFSYQMDLVRKGQMIDRLPDPAFIYVERRDLLGQAISQVRAAQTKKYIAGEPDRKTPAYNRKAIARQLRVILRDQARWREYFAVNAIEPLLLAQEDFVANPGAAVDSVARLFGIAESLEFDPSILPLRQADSLSMEWRARFLAESGDRNRLPDVFAPGRFWARKMLHGLTGRGWTPE